ncbi:hypothetical protein KOW79_003663 [Hemibagrus wyckioides]|uniref:Uncharacterized protein n=1 Tax=Hemibagrus wyckioides TaxID=337641 RepID=A0A9D3SWA6_9TELE|nr:hypothetical protein KOW79_003663 [Hemibagrus wyckioides]
MAESRVGDRNRVRDMYEGVNFFELTSNQRKEHRDKTLHKNPDVLFRIYKEERLHVLLFMPTNAEEWKKVIQDRIQECTNRPIDPSFQLTERRSVNGYLPIINMSGPEHHLEHFCDSFDHLYSQVQENIRNRASTQRDFVAQTLEIDVKIMELQVEIQMLLSRLEETRGQRRGW